MAEWRVGPEFIHIRPHPNADSLQLATVGDYQIVIGKDNGYKDGDLVFFAPERSVLPEDLKGEYVNKATGNSYLTGPNQDRVHRVRLRGEYSEGVTIPPAWVTEKLGDGDVPPYGTDWSERLGITKYEPPIPASLQGQVRHFRGVLNTCVLALRQHDVETFRIYEREFQPGERVVATEKIHGSQISIFRDSEGGRWVTSKGHAKRQSVILDAPENTYWQATRNTEIFDILDGIPLLEGRNVQVWGEAIPVQKGYTYGHTEPTLLVFRVAVDGVDWGIGAVRDHLPALFALWVPILFEGIYDQQAIQDLARGKETVSGKALHIKEGVVLTPEYPRRIERTGAYLALKLISPAYKEGDDSFA